MMEARIQWFYSGNRRQQAGDRMDNRDWQHTVSRNFGALPGRTIATPAQRNRVASDHSWP